MININALTADEQSVYAKLISTLPSTLIDSDLSIYVALIAILGCETNARISELHRQFDINTADEYYLRLLADLNGYKWIESLSVEANRTRMLYNGYRRKYRGTVEAIKNIVRTSLDERFINNAENANIIVQEGTPLPLKYDEALTQTVGTIEVDLSQGLDGYVPYLMLLNQHVITLHVPEEFIIDRSELDEVRPAGTLIYFAYRILLKLTHAMLHPLENDSNLIYLRSPFKLERMDSYGLETPIGKRLTLPAMQYTNTAEHLQQFDVQLTITTV